LAGRWRTRCQGFSIFFGAHHSAPCLSGVASCLDWGHNFSNGSRVSFPTYCGVPFFQTLTFFLRTLPYAVVLFSCVFTPQGQHNAVVKIPPTTGPPSFHCSPPIPAPRITSFWALSDFLPVPPSCHVPLLFEHLLDPPFLLYPIFVL